MCHRVRCAVSSLDIAEKRSLWSAPTMQLRAALTAQSADWVCSSNCTEIARLALRRRHSVTDAKLLERLRQGYHSRQAVCDEACKAPLQNGHSIDSTNTRSRCAAP